MLRLQPIEPFLLVCARQLRLGLLRQCDEIRQMPALPFSLLATLTQPVACIRAHGLQEPVATRAFSLFGNHQAFVDKRSKQLQRRTLVEAIASAESLRRCQRPPAGEY